MLVIFIGFTLDHSPLPGVRKSGIPEAVLTPAPVKQTVYFESFINSLTSFNCFSSIFGTRHFQGNFPKTPFVIPGIAILYNTLIRKNYLLIYSLVKDFNSKFSILAKH